MQEERVVGLRRSFGDCQRSGVGQVIAGADDETVELDGSGSVSSRPTDSPAVARIRCGRSKLTAVIDASTFAIEWRIRPL